MMYSDYFALSACAFSVVYVPFFIIAQLRFAHVMQNEGYINRSYFGWLKRNFFGAYVPLIGVSVMLVLSELAVHAFLYKNSLFFDMELIVAFVVVTMLVALALAIILWKYIKHIKRESDMTPLVCSRRFLNVYIISCLVVAAMTAVVNVFNEINRIVFFLPLLVPLLAPLSNWIAHGRKPAGKHWV